MRSGPSAADEAEDAGGPEQRLTLILSLFRLYRATIPDPVRLRRIIDEVVQAETHADYCMMGTPSALLRQRTVLCDAVVRRFLATVPCPPSAT